MLNKRLYQIQQIYQQGGNIISYLKQAEQIKSNSTEIIQIAYDFQAGSYIKAVEKNKVFYQKYTQAIADVIDNLRVKYHSILEVGVGEATTLSHLIPKLKQRPRRVLGLDISWSRIRYGLVYSQICKLPTPSLFVADLFNIPLADNSIDIVYTSHSIEPNGGKEKQALQELIRVANKYLVLLEPSYEFADTESKKRMKQHGYITQLGKAAKQLKLNIVEHRLFDHCSNPLNPTGLMVIKKQSRAKKPKKHFFLCPISKTSLKFTRGCYYTKKGRLVYPIIDQVPCLLPENAVVATHFLSDFL